MGLLPNIPLNLPKVIPLFIITLLCLAGREIAAQKPNIVLPSGHKGGVMVMTASTNEEYLLSGSVDKSIKVWEIATGYEVRTLEGHTFWVSALDLNDQDELLLSGSDNGELFLWDFQTGTHLRSFDFHEGGITFLQFIPDTYLAVSAGDDGMVAIWNWQTGELQVKWKASDDWIQAGILDPENDRLFIASQDQSISVWDLNTQTLLQRWEAHADGVKSLDYLPERQLLASCAGSGDDRFLVWNSERFESRDQVRGFASEMPVVRLLPDGNRLLFSTREKEIVLWDLASDREIRRFRGHQLTIFDLLVIGDGAFFVSAGLDNAMYLWDTESGRQIRKFTGATQEQYALALSPDGRLLAVGEDEGWVSLWDLNKQQLKWRQKEHQKSLVSVALSLRNNVVLSSSVDGAVHAWDLHSGAHLNTFAGHQLSPIIVVDSTERQLITGGREGNLFVWDFLNAEVVDTLAVNGPPITCVYLAPDNRRLLVGYRNEGQIAVWDWKESKKIREFTAHSGSVYSLTTNFRGDRWITCGEDGGIRLFNGADFQLLAEYQREDAFFENPYLHPNGKDLLVSGGEYFAEDNLIFHFQIQTNEGRDTLKLLGTYDQHRDGVTDITGTADGRFFITASMDHSFKIWPWKGTRERATGLPIGDHGFLFYTPDLFYTGSKDAVKSLNFQLENRNYPFIQYDLALNRPDLIAAGMPSVDSSRLSQLKTAVDKRRQWYGFTDSLESFQPPDCSIPGRLKLPYRMEKDILDIPVRAGAFFASLKQLNVLINGVPIYGKRGLRIDQSRLDTLIALPLNVGENEIAISAVDEYGMESLPERLNVIYEPPEESTPPGDLYVAAIGVSNYREKGKTLRFAAKDAQDVAAFYQKSKAFDHIHTKILLDTLAQKETILALRAWLRSTTVNDQVILFVSGHGLLDSKFNFYFATYDTDFSRPEDRGIPFEEIESLLDGIPARKKLLFVDACHSGEFDAGAAPLSPQQLENLQQKGVRFQAFAKGDPSDGPSLGLQNSFEMMQQLFVDLQRGSGATIITSSSGVQVSFEDPDWQNGAFTYALLYGLKSFKADADKDGKITASEIQAFVVEYVPRLTEGLQVPTFRQENLKYDFRVW